MLIWRNQLSNWKQTMHHMQCRICVEIFIVCLHKLWKRNIRKEWDLWWWKFRRLSEWLLCSESKLYLQSRKYWNISFNLFMHPGILKARQTMSPNLWRWILIRRWNVWWWEVRRMPHELFWPCIELHLQRRKYHISLRVFQRPIVCQSRIHWKSFLSEHNSRKQYPSSQFINHIILCDLSNELRPINFHHSRRELTCKNSYFHFNTSQQLQRKLHKIRTKILWWWFHLKRIFTNNEFWNWNQYDRIY